MSSLLCVLASLKELTFSWMSFAAGTGSAVTSAAKAILSKKVECRQSSPITHHPPPSHSLPLASPSRISLSPSPLGA